MWLCILCFPFAFHLLVIWILSMSLGSSYTLIRISVFNNHLLVIVIAFMRLYFHIYLSFMLSQSQGPFSCVNLISPRYHVLYSLICLPKIINYTCSGMRNLQTWTMLYQWAQNMDMVWKMSRTGFYPNFLWGQLIIPRHVLGFFFLTFCCSRLLLIVYIYVNARRIIC